MSGSNGMLGSITEIAGITIGHHHRIDDDVTLGHGWAAGTTVVRIGTPESASAPPVVAGEVRGGGPGTRETDLLDPANTVQTAHAIVLSGGSAFGLSAAHGVMTSLEAAGVGLPMDLAGHVVPIVPAAVIFDLPVGAWDARPDADFGTRALANASTEVADGSVGAGAGARAGALKGGVGTASMRCSAAAAGVTVGAVMVANPVGAVIDPTTGLPWTASAAELAVHGLTAPAPEEVAALAELDAEHTALNTTIGVVATDAALDKASVRRVAMAAHDGLGRAIRPAHLPLDGDTIFAVATGAVHPSPQTPMPPGMNPDALVLGEVCRVAAIVVERAIVAAVLSATSVAGIPTYRDVVPSAFA